MLFGGKFNIELVQVIFIATERIRQIALFAFHQILLALVGAKDRVEIANLFGAKFALNGGNNKARFQTNFNFVFHDLGESED